MNGTLRASAHKGHRASRLRIARTVAIAIGITLLSPMDAANTGQIDAFKNDPRKYINATMNKTEATCIKLLISKESAWNHEANNPNSTAYGIAQVLGTKPGTPAPLQIERGLAYIEHRYDKPSVAWAHWRKHGWY